MLVGGFGGELVLVVMWLILDLFKWAGCCTNDEVSSSPLSLTDSSSLTSSSFLIIFSYKRVIL